MDGIPPPLPSDPEEVAWALETAETLWKRGERVDAVVWVRRAANVAGECDDRARSATLLRQAEELSAWIGSNTVPPPGESERPPKSGSVEALDALLSQPPPPVPREGSETFTLSTNDVELLSSRDTRSLFPDVEIIDEHDTNFPSSFPEEEPTPIVRQPRSAVPEPAAPSAAHTHAGMLDPWADGDRGGGKKRSPIPRDERQEPEEPALTFDEEEVVTSAKRNAAPPPASLPTGSIPHAPNPPQVNRKGRALLPEEADTTTYRQINPRSPSGVDRAEAAPAPERAPSRLPSMGPLARPRSIPPERPPAKPSVKPPAAESLPPAFDLLEMIDATTTDDDEPAPTKPAPAAPPLPAAARMASTRPTGPPLRVSSRPTALPPRVTSSIPAAALPSAAPAAPTSGSPTAAPPSDSISGVPTAAPPSGPTGAPPADQPSLDLSAVEALTDLPDDARDAFARAAVMHTLASDEEVSHFALALVVDGEIDVSATIVDAPALRLAKSSVLRSRGSILPGVPLRLVCASAKAIVATWDDAAVEQAFRTCPWVEEDLRTVADRVQAQAGVTMGPLGERFDQSLRAHFTGKLTVRNLAPGEVLIEQGKPTPIAIVGIGEIHIVKDGARTETLGSGDFVFPTQILAHAHAPASAVAGPAGAVVLFGDRAVAQELLMSFPPLLEVLASI